MPKTNKRGTGKVEEAIRLMQRMIQLKSIEPSGYEEPIARSSVLNRQVIRAEEKRLEIGRANLITRIKGSEEN